MEMGCMRRSSMQFKNIFWDLDGTLIDSEYVYKEATLHACKELRMDFDINNVKTSSGKDAITVFELILGEPLTTKHHTLYHQWNEISKQYLINNFNKVQQIPQAIELVHEFARLGIKQSIVSNATSKIIWRCVENLKIGQYLLNIIGRDSVKQGKPHPEPYLQAMQLHETVAKDCLVFEDSHTGIQSAFSAGIKVIGVGDTQDLPIIVDHICNLNDKSWLQSIKSKYFVAHM